MRLAIQSSNSRVLSNGLVLRIESWSTGTVKSENDFWAVKVLRGDDVISIERFPNMKEAYKVFRGYKRNLAH